MSDLNNMYVVDSTALMATQKYGKVRIGQAIRSESGVNFDLWVLSHFVTNSGFDRWVLRNRIFGVQVLEAHVVSAVCIADSHSQSTPNDGSENSFSHHATDSNSGKITYGISGRHHPYDSR
jgi:hypothetical protein